MIYILEFYFKKMLIPMALAVGCFGVILAANEYDVAEVIYGDDYFEWNEWVFNTGIALACLGFGVAGINLMKQIDVAALMKTFSSLFKNRRAARARSSLLEFKELLDKKIITEAEYAAKAEQLKKDLLD